MAEAVVAQESEHFSERGGVVEPYFWVAPLVGGIMIGLASAALMAFNGRIAGISGIFSGLMLPAAAGGGENREERSWRAAFVGGLLVGGALMWILLPGAFTMMIERSRMAIAVAGLLVGLGTRMGSGCTSGHGICGLSRFSPRSLVATVTFIASGVATVFVVRHLLGGGV
ncbi:MAG: YeeE/YedE family protein [Myxococcota bacterium]